MNTKLVYWFVLLMVISAWFGKSTTKPKPSTETKHVNTKGITAPILIGAAAKLGLTPDKWENGGKCNIEYINGELMTSAVYDLKKDETHHIVGWAVDTEKARLPQSVIIRFARKDEVDFFAKVNYGIARPDVKEHFFLDNELLASGYEVSIAFNTLLVGEYDLTLIMRNSDVTYICDNGRKILIH